MVIWYLVVNKYRYSMKTAEEQICLNLKRRFGTAMLVKHVELGDVSHNPHILVFQ